MLPALREEKQSAGRSGSQHGIARTVMLTYICSIKFWRICWQHRSSFFQHLHPAQSSLSNGGPTSSTYDPAFSSHSTSSPSQVFHHPLPHETYHSLHSPYPSHHLTARGTINVHAFGRHTFPPPPQLVCPITTDLFCTP